MPARVRLRPRSGPGRKPRRSNPYHNPYQFLNSARHGVRRCFHFYAAEVTSDLDPVGHLELAVMVSLPRLGLVFELLNGPRRRRPEVFRGTVKPHDRLIGWRHEEVLGLLVREKLLRGEHLPGIPNGLVGNRYVDLGCIAVIVLVGGLLPEGVDVEVLSCAQDRFGRQHGMPPQGKSASSLSMREIISEMGSTLIRVFATILYAPYAIDFIINKKLYAWG